MLLPSSDKLRLRAWQTRARGRRTKQHSSGKAEEPGVGNVAASPATPAPLWISGLGRDKLPGLAGGCAGAARFTSETQAIPRQTPVQTESVRHREKRTGESAGAAGAGSCTEF